MRTSADHRACRRWMLLPALLALLWPISAIAADPPLYERIDAMLDAAYLGPPGSSVSDGEFLRRASLDLVGVIPTAAEVKAFLDDDSPQKRVALVDRLLASPEHARHMATVFDVMIAERRSDKGVKSADWQAFLYDSFLANKPYNQLAREILAAECKEGTSPPPAKFYHDRDVEPNLLTRDIGRIFFGMDMQCAQCHNHPLVDDYYQSDYYGLYAFVSRSYVFRSKANTSLAEKPDGEASFKSVFTGFAMDKVAPRVPKGPTAVEPAVAKGEEYLVPPGKDKEIKPIPKVSRRALLADAATGGQSGAFNRNIVNRLWAHMFGRGLVHPVDYQHPDNPPSHPAMLALLAEDFVARKFDIRSFLRELALTRAYQRSCDVPAPESVKGIDTAPRVAALTVENEKLAAAAKASQAAVAKITTDLTAAREAAVAAKPDAAKVAAAQKTAKDAADKAAAGLAAAEKELKKKQEAAQVVAEAAAKAKLAVEKLPADKELAAAAQQIETRSAALAAEFAAAQQAATERSAAAKAAADEVAKLAMPSDAEQKARARVLALDAELAKAQTQAAADTVAAADVAARWAEAQGLAEFQRLAASADQQAAALAWENLVDQWGKRFAWMPLKPLSPEQMAWSVMQVTGQVAAQRIAIDAELQKKPPAGVNLADASKKAAEMEKQTFQKLQSASAAFVNTFSNGAGQPPDVFQPSVGQALFLANSPAVQGLMSASSTNLTGRLAAMKDTAELADEMYASVLTRSPTDDERSEVAAYLTGRDSDRPAAVQEMLWGLVSSIEFRFNH